MKLTILMPSSTSFIPSFCPAMTVDTLIRVADALMTAVWRRGKPVVSTVRFRGVLLLYFMP